MKVILSVPDEGYSERTWWRLFQKLVVRTKLYIYVFITQIVTYFVIPNNKINTSGICFQVSEWFLLAAKRTIFVSYIMKLHSTR
jgi:hypothetical protein